MIGKEIIKNIFHDLFIWSFAMLLIFAAFEYRFTGFVISYINLSWWFLGTLIAGGAYLGVKWNRDV